MRHRLSVEQPSASCARGASLTNQLAKTILHQNVPREHILFCGRVGSLGAVGEGGALLIERDSVLSCYEDNTKIGPDGSQEMTT